MRARAPVPDRRALDSATAGRVRTCGASPKVAQAMAAADGQRQVMLEPGEHRQSDTDVAPGARRGDQRSMCMRAAALAAKSSGAGGGAAGAIGPSSRASCAAVSFVYLSPSFRCRRRCTVSVGRSADRAGAVPRPGHRVCSGVAQLSAAAFTSAEGKISGHRQPGSTGSPVVPAPASNRDPAPGPGRAFPRTPARRRHRHHRRWIAHGDPLPDRYRMLVDATAKAL